MRFTEVERRTIRRSAGVNEKLGVVFHHTAGSFEGSVHWLSTDPRGTASAHVVIAKDGRRAILADDDAITWHAGASLYRGRTGCNRFMLGVEFELTAEDVQRDAWLTAEQVHSAIEWVLERWDKYGWTLDWMTDHRFVATPPGRKADLSLNNWRLLQQAIDVAVHCHTR